MKGSRTEVDRGDKAKGKGLERADRKEETLNRKVKGGDKLAIAKTLKIIASKVPSTQIVHPQANSLKKARSKIPLTVTHKARLNNKTQVLMKKKQIKIETQADNKLTNLQTEDSSDLGLMMMTRIAKIKVVWIP